jgi:hypothetical protein
MNRMRWAEHVAGRKDAIYKGYIYRCPRRNVPNFERLLKYTDITQNTCIYKWGSQKIRFPILLPPNNLT